MAKGKLTNTEKYAIQGMLHDRTPIKEIASELGRTSTTIKKYIDNELDELVTTIASAQVQASLASLEKQIEEDAPVPVPELEPVSPELRAETVERLKQAGMDELMANEKIDHVLTLLDDGVVISEVRQLYGLCMRTLNAKDLMVTRTSSLKRPGVTMMTQEASDRGDLNKKRVGTVSRTARESVFKPKQGRMLNG